MSAEKLDDVFQQVRSVLSTLSLEQQRFLMEISLIAIVGEQFGENRDGAIAELREIGLQMAARLMVAGELPRAD